LRTKIDGSMSLDRDACFLSPLLFRLITDKGYFHIQSHTVQHHPAHDFIPLGDAGHRHATGYHATGIAVQGLPGICHTDLPVDARDASLFVA